MSMNDLDRHIETLRNGDILREPVVKALCNRVKDILVEEANIQRVQSPVNIVGDLHGQLHDLIELFRVAGEMPQCNYLFLGDYVDRGYYSVETFLLLVALKVRFLDRVTLIRGNHESRQITQVYGFFDECLRKYASVAVWRLCAEVFDFLALAALVDDAALCVHGGLSPNIKTLDEIRSISRRVEVPHEGAMCDLLWSDPSPDSTGWHFSPRGAGFLFGEEITRAFNQANGIDLVCRAHQLVMDGYNQMFYRPSEEPSRRTGLVTVWSAPNYCYRCGNIAAVLRFNEHLDQDYLTFEAAPRDSRRTDTKKPVPDYFL